VNQFNSVLELYTATLKSHIGLANTLLGGARRMRLCQIEQINASASDCGMLSDMVDTVQDFDALQSVHAKLLDVQLERTYAYWSGMATAMATTNEALSGTLQGWCDAATEDLCQAVDTLQCSETPTAALSNLMPLFDPSHYFAFTVLPDGDFGAVPMNGMINGSAWSMVKATNGRSTAKARRGANTTAA